MFRLCDIKHPIPKLVWGWGRSVYILWVGKYIDCLPTVVEFVACVIISAYVAHLFVDTSPRGWYKLSLPGIKHVAFSGTAEGGGGVGAIALPLFLKIIKSC